MTSPVVDLAAVAQVRAELAALVAAHPSLTSPEAHARLAAALPEMTMPPRLDPESADSTIIGVRLSREMLSALDAEVARQRVANPDVAIGRSNVLRGIMRRALLNQASPQPVAAPPAPEEPPLVRAPSLPPVRLSALPPRVSADLAAELIDGAPSVALPPQPRVAADLAAEPPPVKPLKTVAAVRNRLLELRAADPSAWSLRVTAKRAGMSPTPVQKILRGENVTAKILAKMAAILPPQRTGK